MARLPARPLVLPLLLLLAACASSPQQESRSPLPLSGFALREREAERDRERADLRTPGAEHRRLDVLVGDFNATIRYWPAAGEEPLTSKATTANTWILGGRFLACELRGELDGRAWERHSTLGYDRARKVYVETRVESTSTELPAQAEGRPGERENDIVFTRSYDDVVTGERVHLREVLSIDDWSHHRLELWIDPPLGEAHRLLEIRYDRIR